MELKLKISCPNCGDIDEKDINILYVDEDHWKIERLLEGEEVEINWLMCKRCNEFLRVKRVK